MADNAPGKVMFGEEARSEEGLLLSHLERIGDDRAGMYSVHVHLSELRAGNRKPHFINIAARSFENLVANHEVTLFRLANQDFILICREVPIEDVDPVLNKVRALFSEDPLTFGEEGAIDDRFSTWYDISMDGDLAAFQAAIVQIREEVTEKAKATAALVGSGKVMGGEAIDPARLSAISQLLFEINISDLIHQQTAVVIFPGANGELLFREHYVSMPGLQQRLAPGVNLFGNIWLFQYLTEILDKRTLTELARQRVWEFPDPISINLNVSTVMAREFQTFNREAAEKASKIVIEFQVVDVFSNIDIYKSARDLLQSRGYRVLIDGLNPLSLNFFDPGLLGADFIKINWAQEFLSDLSEVRISEMRRAVDEAGKDSVILARVDTEAAIEWALNLGVTRFQGHYVDVMVAQMVKKGII